MKGLLLSLTILSFLIVSCGEIEKEKIPGADNKGLSNGEIQQSREVLGALGDLHHVIDRLVESQAPFVQRNLDRTTLRRQLSRSMNIDQCVTQTEGSFDFGKYHFGAYGKNCPVGISYRQNRRILTETKTSKVLLFQFETKFSSQSSLVKTNIAKMEVSGEYQEIDELKNGLVIKKKESEIKLSGRSRTAGQIEYKLEESHVKTYEQGSLGSNSLYERTDDFLALKSYQVTLYQKTDYVNGEATSRKYFLNGEAISQGEYQDIIQLLNDEWSYRKFSRP